MQRTVVPYAAILYDTEGATWVYTSHDSLTHVSASDHCRLHRGRRRVYFRMVQTSGSAVVTVGAAELYGSESEFEEE